MLLPSVINIVHSAEDHDHNTHCENKSDTHIHETELDCSLCDLIFLNDGVLVLPPNSFSQLIMKYLKTLRSHKRCTSLYIKLKTQEALLIVNNRFCSSVSLQFL